MHGKTIRMKQLYKHGHKLLLVAMDHGVTLGPVRGLVHLDQTVDNVFQGKADGIIVHKGMIRYLKALKKQSGGALIVHLSASTSQSPDPNQKELVTTVEQAIQLGATAISVHVNIGSDHEAEMLKDLGHVSEACHRWGMPLLAMMYVRDGDKNHEFDAEKIAHAARAAEELGADIVKVNYSGDPTSFQRVTEGVTIPVVIAGGDKVNSTLDLLNMIYDATEAGAGGISIGRNIFQHDEAELLSRVIRRILDGELQKADLTEAANKIEGGHDA